MKSQYSRYFVTMRQDNRGYGFRGREPFGRCIIESRGDQGKLWLYAQDLKPQVSYKAYLVSSDSSGGVLLDSLTVDERGRGELRYAFDPSDVANTGMPISEFNVVVVLTPVQNDIICPLVGYRDNVVMWKPKFEILNPRPSMAKEEPPNEIIEAGQPASESITEEEEQELKELTAPVVEDLPGEVETDDAVLRKFPQPLDETKMPVEPQQLDETEMPEKPQPGESELLKEIQELEGLEQLPQPPAYNLTEEELKELINLTSPVEGTDLPGEVETDDAVLRESPPSTAVEMNEAFTLPPTENLTEAELEELINLTTTTQGTNLPGETQSNGTESRKYEANPLGKFPPPLEETGKAPVVQQKPASTATPTSFPPPLEEIEPPIIETAPIKVPQSQMTMPSSTMVPSNGTQGVQPQMTMPSSTTVPSNGTQGVQPQTMTPSSTTIPSNGTQGVQPQTMMPSSTTVPSNGTQGVQPQTMMPSSTTVPASQINETQTIPGTQPTPAGQPAVPGQTQPASENLGPPPTNSIPKKILQPLEGMPEGIETPSPTNSVPQSTVPPTEDEYARDSDFFSELTEQLLAIARAEEAAARESSAKTFVEKVTEPEAPVITETAKKFLKNFKELERLNWSQETSDHYDELENIFANNERITPFMSQTRSVKWVRVEPHELITLPIDARKYMNSPFVACAYKKYRHLILGAVEGKSKEYILGVPEVYDSSDKLMAHSLGFTQFKSCKDMRLLDGEYGYWLMSVPAAR